jgi:hypothetical protein
LFSWFELKASVLYFRKYQYVLFSHGIRGTDFSVQCWWTAEFASLFSTIIWLPLKEGNHSHIF